METSRSRSTARSTGAQRRTRSTATDNRAHRKPHLASSAMAPSARPAAQYLVLPLAAAAVFLILGALVSCAVGAASNNSPLPSSPSSSAPAQQESAPAGAIVLPGAQPIATIDPSQLDEGGLWFLVNKTGNTVSLEYVPQDLVVPNVPLDSNINSEELQIRQVAASGLEAMIRAAAEEDIDLELTSGFRTSASQQFYYSNAIKEVGETNANHISAKPGTSEHQLGLAVDLTSPSGGYDLDAAFGETRAGQWLRDNAWRFGFILRYPREFEEQTGYNYEPWHFRYIGGELAGAMHAAGMKTFEEVYPYLIAARDALRTAEAQGTDTQTPVGGGEQ